MALCVVFPYIVVHVCKMYKIQCTDIVVTDSQLERKQSYSSPLQISKLQSLVSWALRAAVGAAINNDCVFPADTGLQKAVWQASLLYYYKLFRSVCIKCANNHHRVAIVSIQRHCQWPDGPSRC